MHVAVALGLLLAAPPRLVLELENRHEAGLFPVPPVLEPGEEIDPNADPDDTDSISQYRMTLVPTVEGRWDTRAHELAVRYNPRLLFIEPPPTEDTDQLLFLNRAGASHVWRFAPGADLSTDVGFESGRADFVLVAAGAPFAPEDPVIAYTQGRIDSALRLETGDVEAFTIRFGAAYQEPWRESEGTIFAFYRVGTGVEYSHYLARRLDGVLDIGFEHLDFFELDQQTRRVSLRAGLTWEQRRNLTWDLRGGVQLIDGDVRRLLEEEEATTESFQDALPAARLEMDWTFFESTQGIAGLVWDAEIDAFVDPALGSYVPLVSTGVALRYFQPWGNFRTEARFGTPLSGSQTAELSLSPTFYSFSAELEIPVSVYFFVFAQGRFSQRAAEELGARDFDFGFTEAAGVVGLRLWWSSGRDERLPRPAEVLESEDEG